MGIYLPLGIPWLIVYLMVLMFDITVMRNGEKFHDSLHTYTNFSCMYVDFGVLALESEITFLF